MKNKIDKQESITLQRFNQTSIVHHRYDSILSLLVNNTAMAITPMGKKTYNGETLKCGMNNILFILSSMLVAVMDFAVAVIVDPVRSICVHFDSANNLCDFMKSFFLIPTIILPIIGSILKATLKLILFLTALSVSLAINIVSIITRPIVTLCHVTLSYN